jgi:hypothetical protein
VIEAKKPLAIYAILASGPILFGLSDSVISIADTDTPNNEVTANPSTSAIITITMTGILNM